MGYAPTPDKFSFVNAILLPLSGLYWLCWRCYEIVYILGLKKAKSAHPKIVVIGNLIAGGAGKSPLTVETAKLLAKSGHQVVLGVSGYGSPMSHGAQLAPEGKIEAAIYGDEAAMLRDFLPETPIIVGRRRVLAAEICQKTYPNSVLLMDDGLQHKPLKHKIAVVIDLDRPKNPFVLPAGPYREPRRNLKRAKIAIPRDFKIIQNPPKFVNALSKESVVPKGMANLLCSIARPERFVEAVNSAGFELDKVVRLPDHASIQTLEWPFDFANLVIVTAKDWVKLRDRKDLPFESIIIAYQQVQIDQEEAYLNRLNHELNQ